ncbi:MAG: bifunctional methylenetetrahydrofolate dehydrogenase/methenyltetrahydrofolate cyclohydrolase, partial [Candidatus Aenigmarchaeota archaeon]|nr:bifunctional methylenetetrahydrofolate dehydrogenase/methenyltetrahydrofolate cyclohydrolase [Candidatus Aenigmarchaeota archaeon]
MTAKIMDGKKVSEEVRKDLKKRAENLREKGVQARLDIILVGNNPASEIYVSKKIQSSREIGIKTELHKFPEDAKQEELLETIE